MAKERAKCVTIIPAVWPQLTGPKATGHVSEDRSAWAKHLRTLAKVGPTPKVTR